MTHWLLALTLAAASAQGPRVEFLRGTPLGVTDAATVRYYVRVPLNPDNRTLRIEAIDALDDATVRASEIDLAAEPDRAVWHVAWRLPGGELTLVASVFGPGGRLLAQRARHKVRVIALSW